MLPRNASWRKAVPRMVTVSCILQYVQYFYFTISNTHHRFLFLWDDDSACGDCQRCILQHVQYFYFTISNIHHRFLFLWCYYWATELLPKKTVGGAVVLLLSYWALTQKDGGAVWQSTSNSVPRMVTVSAVSYNFCITYRPQTIYVSFKCFSREIPLTHGRLVGR